MRISKLLSIGLLAILGTSAIAQTAMAGVAKDSTTGDIYVTGFSARASGTAFYTGVPLKKSASANECGVVKLSFQNALPSSRSFIFEGQSPITVSSIPSGVAPKCANGQLTDAPASGYVQVSTSAGRSYYFTGKSPFIRYEVTLQGSASERSVSSNACGFVRLSNADKYKNPTGTIEVYQDYAGTVANFDPASVATVTAPPMCKNNTLLLPPGFPN